MKKCKKCNELMDHEDLGDDDCRKMCWVCPTCDIIERDY